MMRNLEYCFPGRGYADIKDQFMMGDNLLVAPVVEKGAKSRKVVLPPEKWKADDGQIHTGLATIKVPTLHSRLPHLSVLTQDLRQIAMLPTVDERCDAFGFAHSETQVGCAGKAAVKGDFLYRQ